MAPDERAAYLEEKSRKAVVAELAATDLQYGQVNPQMICPHCQSRGKVRTKRVTQKRGISDGKAAAISPGVKKIADPMTFVMTSSVAPRMPMARTSLASGSPDAAFSATFTGDSISRYIFGVLDERFAERASAAGRDAGHLPSRYQRNPVRCSASAALRSWTVLAFRVAAQGDDGRDVDSAVLPCREPHALAADGVQVGVVGH